MTAIEGDKGIVFSAGSVYSTFTPVSTPEVGDQVMLYNLGGGQRLAVPVLTFSLGNFAFVTPSFQFAGFDFKLDWNFNLISFLRTDVFTDLINLHDLFFWEPTVGWSAYGDTPPPATKITSGGSHGGDQTWAFWSSHGYYDVFLEIKILSATEFEWWYYQDPYDNHEDRFSYKGVQLSAINGETGHGTATI